MCLLLANRIFVHSEKTLLFLPLLRSGAPQVIGNVLSIPSAFGSDTQALTQLQLSLRRAWFVQSEHLMALPMKSQIKSNLMQKVELPK